MFSAGETYQQWAARVKPVVKAGAIGLEHFWRAHWKGLVVIAVATLVFFLPVVVRIDSYSEGGDQLFNAWTLARDQHCILRQSCPNYADGNIFFPHHDTMLYSETQLSAGLLTLPLSWINSNPLFSYNVWTILSFFFAGLFMYLLAKRLSGGHELIAIAAGLLFEFAPERLSSATHLQSLSIFYLPLAVLLILRYMDTNRKRYLAGLFVTLVLLFYASWYQMVFALAALAIIVVLLPVCKLLAWRQAGAVAGVVAAAALTTLPLAIQYVHFSRQNNASFHIGDQLLYSSHLVDYVTPHQWSGLGRLLIAIAPQKFVDRFSPDTYLTVFDKDGASYAGISLTVVAVVLLVIGLRWYWQTFRRRPRKQTPARTMLLVYTLIFGAVAFAGFVMSLGPFVQLHSTYAYGQASGYDIVLPGPWLLVDKFLPQLQFIRAIGRASVLVLFGLCCILALLPGYLTASSLRPKRQRLLVLVVVALAFFDLLPLHQVRMRPYAVAYHQHIPELYQYIKARPEIDDLIILRTMGDYFYQGKQVSIPMAVPQDVLWAGYTNRNIFNGYSGYTPPEYGAEYADFVDLHADDILKMQKLGLRYVVIDKELSAANPVLITRAASLFHDKVYEDTRYVLYKLPS